MQATYMSFSGSNIEYLSSFTLVFCFYLIYLFDESSNSISFCCSLNSSTFSTHSSKNAKLASLSDTNERSSMKRLNNCVFMILSQNLWYALSRLFRKPEYDKKGRFRQNKNNLNHKSLNKYPQLESRSAPFRFIRILHPTCMGPVYIYSPLISNRELRSVVPAVGA